MARNSPYQRARMGLSVPKIDFAASKATARGFANLTQALDRMTSQIMDREKIKAKAAGEDYGAENAPTNKQIEDAFKTGEDITIPGDKGGSLFERSAYASGAQVISDQISVLARKTISEKVNEANLNEHPPSWLLNEINIITDGYFKTLDETDPKLAKGFRAETAAIGNSQYNAYSKLYIAQIKVKDKAIFESGLDTEYNKILPRLFDMGINVSADPNDEFFVPATVNLINGLKQRTIDAAVRAGYTRSEIIGLRTEYDKRIQEAATAYIGDAIRDSDDKFEMYTDILDGNVSANLQVALDIADSGIKGSAEKAARDAWTQSYEDESFVEAQKKKFRTGIMDEVNDKLVPSLKIMAIDPVLGTKEYLEVIDSYMERIPELASELLVLREKVTSLTANGNVFNIPIKSNDSTIAELEIMLSSQNAVGTGDNQINLAMLQGLFLDSRLTTEDFSKYSDIIRARMNTDFSNAMKTARGRLQIPDGMIFDFGPNNDYKDRMNKLGEIEADMLKAQRTDPNFIASEWMDANLSQYIESTDDEEVTGLQNLLDDNDRTKKQLEQELNSNVNERRKIQIRRILEAALDERITLKDNWLD
tara:strand:+ start:849 stop:2624 length:1776 start_codon:yes stop_codon:yes gene_type:complete